MESSELRRICADNLRRLRKGCNLTQEKFAELADLSVQTIADIEGSRTWVSDRTLVKIADILKTTPGALLTDFGSDSSDTLYGKKNELLNELVTKISEVIDNYNSN